MLFRSFLPFFNPLSFFFLTHCCFIKSRPSITVATFTTTASTPITGAWNHFSHFTSKVPGVGFEPTHNALWERPSANWKYPGELLCSFIMSLYTTTWNVYCVSFIRVWTCWVFTCPNFKICLTTTTAGIAYLNNLTSWWINPFVRVFTTSRTILFHDLPIIFVCFWDCL